MEEIKKEQALKQVATIVRKWFKLEIGYAKVHKEMGDIFEKVYKLGEENGRRSQTPDNVCLGCREVKDDLKDGVCGDCFWKS